MPHLTFEISRKEADENEPIRRKKIQEANGFAQVLPKDKREVVEVLKFGFGQVLLTFMKTFKTIIQLRITS